MTKEELYPARRYNRKHKENDIIPKRKNPEHRSLVKRLIGFFKSEEKQSIKYEKDNYKINGAYNLLSNLLSDNNQNYLNDFKNILKKIPLLQLRIDTLTACSDIVTKYKDTRSGNIENILLSLEHLVDEDFISDKQKDKSKEILNRLEEILILLKPIY